MLTLALAEARALIVERSLRAALGASGSGGRCRFQARPRL